MARKKKNKNSQTFDVYPYLDQYQYLMRDGGALPWYQTEGPVKDKKIYTFTANGKSWEFDTYEELVAKWNEVSPNINPPPRKHFEPDANDDENVDEGEGKGSPCSSEDMAACKEKGGTIHLDYKTTPPSCNCIEKTEDGTEDGSEEPTVVQKAIQDYKEGKISKEQLDKILKDNPEGGGEEEIVTEKEEVVTEEEVDSGPAVQKSEYEQAVQDYKDGKISRRELDELTQRYSIDPKRNTGYKSGDTQFETLPGSPLHLLANALQSGGKLAKNFGKAPINPKTGKPYEKQDFKKTTVDWGKIANENEADILYNPEILKQFVGGDDDLKVSDLIGSQTTVEAQNFNKFQEDRSQMDIDAGIDPLYSKQTMNKVTGDITYDPVANENYDPDVHGSMPNNPMFQPTREHTDDDLTSGDIAEKNLKDMSLKNLTFDTDGNVIKYEGYGGTGSGEGSMGVWDYDPDKQYGDYEETITINKQNVLDNRKKGLNDDGTEKGSENTEENTEGGPKEVSRVTNEDFSVTITYDDGSTKTMNESSQAKKNREREAKNNPEGKIGLETFVYGGQPSGNKLSFTDIYAKGGDVLKWYEEGGDSDAEDEEIADELKKTDDKNEEEIITEEPCPDPGTCAEEQIWNTETCACQDKGDVNFTEEEITAMDETSIEDSDIVDSTYGEGMQGVKNRFNSATKTGLVGRIGNTYANAGQFGADIADFGSALFKGWENMAKEAEAENEGNTASDMFTVQETSQGIHDVNSGDAWTNKKVDEIYAGNTMKGPLIMQQGGPPAQQAPVEESLNYSALSQFSNNNTWDSEVSYSPEVIAYQKKIMGKMRDGGSLPPYQTKGEKVHDFLEYTPDFPRTSVVPYTGDFTAEQLQNAITRDSTQIESDLDNSWIYRNLIGQDQNHQSNLGPAGRLQLNREWLHKLLNSDTDDQANLLNFYKKGGQLPQYGWGSDLWDSAKSKASGVYNKAKEVYDETDFKTPINKALDYTQTTLSAAGLTPAVGIIPDAINTAISAGRTGHATITGDDDAAKKYGTSLALNAASMVPVAGQAAGVASLANDAVNYASGAQDKTTPVTPSVQVADATPVGGKKGFDFNKTRDFTSKKDDSKIDKVAKRGGEQEVEVDYETLQELIKAGADIEII